MPPKVKYTHSPFTNKLDAITNKAYTDTLYVKQQSDTMGGTLSFSDLYVPSPADTTQPAIKAGRDIVLKSGCKLIFDGESVV